MTQQGKNAIDLVLAESLIELSAKKPIDKFTIKEITDQAGVIRPTFYNHFQDKYELIEWIINNISANSVFYKKALKLEGAVTFNQIAMKCVCEMFMNIISEKSTGKKSKYRWLTPEVISTYYAQSLCFITEGWIAQGMDDIEPKEMAEAYMYLITRSMDDILSEL